MKETPRRRITVTSSLNKISTNQPGNTVGGGEVRRGLTSPALHPFLKQPSRQIFKDDVNGFPSTSLRQNVASHNVYVTKRNCY